MHKNWTPSHSLHSLLAFLLYFLAGPAISQDWSAVATADGSAPTERHESAAVVVDGKIYLFGGRGIRPVDVYDPEANTWTTIAQAPVELHHIQPVVYEGKIYIIGSFACCFPNETTIADIHVFNPQTNQWTIEGSMPSNRLRGSAGTVVHNNKIYVIGGNTLGHSGGMVNWFDEYNPANQAWKVMPDAPTARDHFSAAIVGEKLVAAAGRQSNRNFSNTVASTDVYDFTTGQWSTESDDIPTPRAGTMATVYNQLLYVLGGESTSLLTAHATAEVFNPANGQWRKLVDMITPRHAGGLGLIGNDLHLFVGATARGGSGETNLHEKINLNLAPLTALPRTQPTFLTVDSDGDGLSDFEETNTHMTDPNTEDSDGDGLNDKIEIFTTITDPNNSDSDSDDVSDFDEMNLGLDPNNQDTDGDNLNDGAELSIHNTLPTNQDTDGDTINDGDEVNVYQTDPLSEDSDGDTIADGIELLTLNSNPKNTDSDNDGLTDDDEFNIHGTSLTTSDSDADGLSDIDELQVHLTDPVKADSDNDGIVDGLEINTFNTNPLESDSDGDGVSDGQEILNGSSLNNPDEDGDGILNAADGTTDTDGDGYPNYADRDSDNDGIPDSIENGFTDVNQDGMLDTKEQIETALEKAKAKAMEPEPEPEPTESVPAPVVRDTRVLEASPQDDDTPVTDQQQVSTVIIAPVATSTTVDTDMDGIPNHLDLDSDQDGVPDFNESNGLFSSSAFRIIELTDIDEDGLDDSYFSKNTLFPQDTDSDLTPDHLDHDSDNDDLFDVLEAGSPDENNDGKIDDFTDSNNDGLGDNQLLFLESALPDEDKDDIPDIIDSEFTSNGCSISSRPSNDPTFLVILLVLSYLFAMRTRKRTIKLYLKR